jgi:integrase
MKFTDKTIQGLKPTGDRHEVWEDNHKGFGLRVSKTKKVWIFLYRYYGKPRRMTLGEYPKMSLADAHAAHSTALQELEKGIDPGREKVTANVIERDAETISDLVELYLEMWARPRKRSADEDERILRKDVIPVMGYRKARSITRKEIIGLMDSIVKRGSPIAANRTLAVVRKMCNFAISRDILEFSPCSAIVAPAKENQRDRVLSEDEIRIVWNGLDKSSMSAGSRLSLKLILVTAQRKGEVLNSEWKEFNLDNRIWTIPAEKAKNGLAHRVPLSALALRLLAEIKSSSGGSAFLFPSVRDTNKPVVDTSPDKALRRCFPTFGDMPAFTPHDLRRTAASQMTSIGISRLVVAKILNHAESGVTAVYDRHGYDEEKRQALETWGTTLHSFLSKKE